MSSHLKPLSFSQALLQSAFSIFLHVLGKKEKQSAIQLLYSPVHLPEHSLNFPQVKSFVKRQVQSTILQVVSIVGHPHIIIDAQSFSVQVTVYSPEPISALAEPIMMPKRLRSRTIKRVVLLNSFSRNVSKSIISSRGIKVKGYTITSFSQKCLQRWKGGCVSANAEGNGSRIHRTRYSRRRAW